MLPRVVWVVVGVVAAVVVARARAYTRMSDVLIGSRVSCSPEEKFCFRFNRLFSAADGKCRPLLAQCGEGGEGVLVAGRAELARQEPRLQAECVGNRCPRHLQSFFWPRGECLEPEAAAVACGGAGPTLNLFGEWECWCSEGEEEKPLDLPRCVAPNVGPQPQEESSCAVPDLWRPLPAEDAPPALAAPCTDEEHRCFARGQVLLQGACLAPLSRGPCAEGEWVVLDRAAHAAAPAGALRAKCAPRLCPAEGQLWIAFEHLGAQDQCPSHDDVARRLCLESEEVHLDAFGYARCITKGADSPFSLPTVREDGVCKPAVRITTPQPVVTPSQPSEEQACTNPPCPIQPIVAATVLPVQQQVSTGIASTTEQVVIVTGITILSEQYNYTGSITESTSQSAKNQLPCGEPPCTILSPAVPTSPSIYQLPPNPDIPSIDQQSGHTEIPSTTVAPSNTEESITSDQNTPSVDNVSVDQIQSNVQTEQQLCVGSSCYVTPTAASIVLSNQEPSTDQTSPTSFNQEVLPGTSISSGTEQQSIAQQPCAQAPCPISSFVVPLLTTVPPKESNPSIQLSILQTPSVHSISPPNTPPVEDLAGQQQLIEHQPCVALPCPNSPVVESTMSTDQQQLNSSLSTSPASPETLEDSLATEQRNVEVSQVNLTGVTQHTGNTNLLAAPVQPDQLNVPSQSNNALLAASAQLNGQSNIPAQPANDVPVVSIHPESSNVPVISLENAPARIPLVPLQTEIPVNPGLENVSAGAVKTGQSDAVVNYVLLGQSHLPVNSV